MLSPARSCVPSVSTTADLQLTLSSLRISKRIISLVQSADTIKTLLALIIATGGGLSGTGEMGGRAFPKRFSSNAGLFYVSGQDSKAAQCGIILGLAQGHEVRG